MIACFIGHRKISVDENFISQLKKRIEQLIVGENFDTFLFGSRSEFNDLCLKIVTELQNAYPKIKRIYVRSAYPYIGKDYEKYLLTFYDKTYIPDKVTNAGKASYVERNQHMIDKSDLCVFYYDETYLPTKKTVSYKHYIPLPYSQPNSGTKLAYQYAVFKKKTVLNVFSNLKTTPKNQL